MKLFIISYQLARGGKMMSSFLIRLNVKSQKKNTSQDKVNPNWYYLVNIIY